jgi:hypothetical protein
MNSPTDKRLSNRLPVIFSLLEDPTAQRLTCLKARPKLWRACPAGGSTLRILVFPTEARRSGTSCNLSERRRRRCP